MSEQTVRPAHASPGTASHGGASPIRCGPSSPVVIVAAAVVAAPVGTRSTDNRSAPGDSDAERLLHDAGFPGARHGARPIRRTDGGPLTAGTARLGRGDHPRTGIRAAVENLTAETVVPPTARRAMSWDIAGDPNTAEDRWSR